MDKTRLSAYVNLIQTLLTCPQGEEWIYLKHYEDIVDAEFLQFMEQVALQLGQEGEPASATFLHNWAAKLHHIWLKEIDPTAPEADKTEAYMTLIQQLLDCPEGMEEHLLIANETLIGPGLVHKMREVSKQMIQQGEEEPAEYLESVASELSQGWLVEHDFSARLEKPTVQSAPHATAPQATSQLKTASQSEHQTKSVPSASKAEADDALDDLSGDLWLDSEKDRSASVPPAMSSAAPVASTQPQQQAPKLREPDVLERGDREAAARKALSTRKALSNGAVATATAPELLTQSVVSQPSQPPIQPAIAQELKAIANALQQLNQTLITARAPDPLHHLEVLEKACAASWQLTTEEIEQLLGVKPKCHAHETVYRRGEWCFTKVGKVGSQTAWKVTKEQA